MRTGIIFFKSDPAHHEINREYLLRKELAYQEAINAHRYSSQPPYRIPAPGETVMMTGMRHHANLNGSKGKIQGSVDLKGFLTVRLDTDADNGKQMSRTMKVRPQCLRPLSKSVSGPALLRGSAAATCSMDDQKDKERMTHREGARPLGSGAIGVAARETFSNFKEARAKEEARAKLAEEYYDQCLHWNWQKTQDKVGGHAVACDPLKAAMLATRCSSQWSPSCLIRMRASGGAPSPTSLGQLHAET